LLKEDKYFIKIISDNDFGVDFYVNLLVAEGLPLGDGLSAWLSPFIPAV
jgi:hypothetical protein